MSSRSPANPDEARPTVGNWIGGLAQPTESLWAMLHRFQALNQLSARECVQAVGFSLKGGQGPSLIYRAPGTLERLHPTSPTPFERVFATLELSAQAARRAMVPLLPFAWGRNVLLYCPACLAIGFHSSVFQLGTLDQCPIHGVTLSNRCPRCHAAIATRFNLELVFYPGRCPTCGLRLLDPLAALIAPLSPAQQTACIRAYEAYATPYEQVVSVYRRQVGNQLPNPTNRALFRLATAVPRLGTTVRRGATVYRLYAIATAGARAPVGPSAPPRIRRARQLAPGTRWPPHWETEPLLNVYRAWRRALERGLPYASRGVVGQAKWTDQYPELDDLWYLREDGQAVAVWFLLWRYVRHNNSTQAGTRRHRERAFGWRVTPEHYAPWYPKPLAEFLDGYAHGLGSGQPPVHDDWPTMQAFAAFLTGLRDEAQAWARALRHHRFPYPYSNCPLQGLMLPDYVITRRAACGGLVACAWRAQHAESTLDATCEREIQRWRRERQERLASIDAMRQARP